MITINGTTKSLFLLHKLNNYDYKQEQNIISQNIFQQNHSSLNGPKYDQQHKIIPRSVVGKPDIIEKVKKRIEESKLTNTNRRGSILFMKLSQNSSQSNSGRRLSIMQKCTGKLQSASDLSSILTRDESKSKFIQIKSYLLETKERIQENERKEKQEEKSLTLFEKNARSRQHRVITSFFDQEQSWEQLNLTLQSKCTTKSLEKLTLVQRSAAYRLKAQLATDRPPVIGQWQNGLRNHIKQDNNSDFVQSQRLPSTKSLQKIYSEMNNTIRITGENKLKTELNDARRLF